MLGCAYPNVYSCTCRCAGFHARRKHLNAVGRIEGSRRHVQRPSRPRAVTVVLRRRHWLSGRGRHDLGVAIASDLWWSDTSRSIDLTAEGLRNETQHGMEAGNMYS